MQYKSNVEHLKIKQQRSVAKNQDTSVRFGKVNLLLFKTAYFIFHATFYGHWARFSNTVVLNFIEEKYVNR